MVKAFYRLRDDVSISIRLITFFAFFLEIAASQQQRHMIVINPGHSHAAAVFENQPAGLSSEVHVYAPPGPEAAAFLHSLAQINARADHPVHWQVESHISPHFLSLLQKEPAGNIAVISGRNNTKIDEILASIRAGQNVLADKPWIIDSRDLADLEAVLTLASRQELVAYDCMTERFNIAYQLQRELMRDKDVFGTPEIGSVSDPAVILKNVHSLIKFDSHGHVNQRPAWFLDIRQQGEAIADVGTHLVDLAFWTLFPDQAIDYRKEIKVLHARHSPLYLTKADFQRLTGEKNWPGFLRPAIHDERLKYDCNSTALFTVRGVHAAISDRWEYESVGALSDTYLVLYRGTHATIRVRQSKLEHYIPELVLIPNSGQGTASWKAMLEKRLHGLASRYPGLTLRDSGEEIHVLIPEADRKRGGSSFDQLVAQYLKYVESPATLPAWETPNMLAKYYLTTKAAELAAQGPQS